MKESKQLILPCCEEMFKKEDAPKGRIDSIDNIDGITTGRFNSSEQNESSNPSEETIIEMKPGSGKSYVIKETLDLLKKDWQ